MGVLPDLGKMKLVVFGHASFWARSGKNKKKTKECVCPSTGHHAKEGTPSRGGQYEGGKSEEKNARCVFIISPSPQYPQNETSNVHFLGDRSEKKAPAQVLPRKACGAQQARLSF